MRWQTGRLEPQAGDDALDAVEVGGAEEAGVHEERGEVVDVAAQLEEAGADGPQGVVGVEEGIAEGVEEHAPPFQLGLGLQDRG